MSQEAEGGGASAAATGLHQTQVAAPKYEGPQLPLRRVEQEEEDAGRYKPEPTHEDRDGNQVHTSISKKWKVYDSEPVPWTDEERKVGIQGR